MRGREMTPDAPFDRLLLAGRPRSALEHALSELEKSRYRDPGGCVVKLHRIVSMLDARGAAAGIPELRARVERAYERARLAVPPAVEALWHPREPEIGSAAFPVVWEAAETSGSALRWARVSSDATPARHAPRDPSVAQTFRTAAEVVAALFPDQAAVTRAARARMSLAPDVELNAHIAGDSLGAAAFVALASYALRRPVSPTHVMTGALSPDGTLRAVDPFTLDGKRAALRELPQATFLVAPGHPLVAEGTVVQIGQLARATELLTLVLGPWWSDLDPMLAVWTDRSWREALRIESWWLELFEQHARVERSGPTPTVAARVWDVLGTQLRDAIDAWQAHFVAGVRREIERAPRHDPEPDDAMTLYEDAPPLARPREVDSTAIVRERVRAVVLRRRATLEQWLARRV